jgi:hypothetical protein
MKNDQTLYQNMIAIYIVFSYSSRIVHSIIYIGGWALEARNNKALKGLKRFFNVCSVFVCLALLPVD